MRARHNEPTEPGWKSEKFYRATVCIGIVKVEKALTWQSSYIYNARKFFLRIQNTDAFILFMPNKMSLMNT